MRISRRVLPVFCLLALVAGCRESATLPLDAQLDWRGTSTSVAVANLSRSGAMLLSAHVPNIGEQVTLTLPGEAAIAAVVRWVRDGRIGLHFAATVG